MMSLTKIHRIHSAIKETAGKLDKELTYSKDLQKPEMISFYRNHLVFLNTLFD